MRRLTLILSDLFLPANAVRESFPVTLALPAFEWLLRFSRRQTIGDWRGWLAADVGAEEAAALPTAHCRASAAQVPAPGAWVATPVSLEARLDHVRLRDRGLLRLSPEHASGLSAEFQHTFGPGQALRDASGRDLLLVGGPDAGIHTVDPARLLDSDIGAALPAGSPAAGELRRLGAEIEMWLPGTQTNTLRERAGQRPIGALWFWGGGLARATSMSHPESRQPFRLWGGDGHLAALAGLCGREPVRNAPRNFADLGEAGSDHVEFAAMSGEPFESLAELEQNWFAPARAALSSGDLDQLRLVANDAVHEIEAGAGWKFWRRRRSWLESLA